MNIFIFIDMSKQFNSKDNGRKHFISSLQNQTDKFIDKKHTSLVGIGGFRNRRIIFMNRAAHLNGIRYGECWNPCTHRDVICLSKREVSKANQTLQNIALYIKSTFGPCDQREKGFFGFKVCTVEDKILIRKLHKIQKEIEFQFNVKCFIGAASTPMIARLSCLISNDRPRITTQPLLKSLISQAPLKIFGIPRKVERVLIQKSAYDSDLLRNLSILQLRELLEIDNQKHALDLFRIIRGIDPFNKQIKIPKKQLSHFLKFDEPISDPLTLYLSIENRWTEFRDFVCKHNIPINKLKCKLLNSERENQNIQVFRNSNGLLPDRISWRKELRNSIYEANIVKPVLAVHLIAEYKQVSTYYTDINLSPATNDNQSNLAKIHISNIVTKLRKNREDRNSKQRLNWLNNGALKRNDHKQTESFV